MLPDGPARWVVGLIDRRALLLGAAATLAVPRSASPQTKVFRLGLLSSSSPGSPEAGHIWQAFFDGMRELGYVEGRNFLVEGRYYGDRIEDLPGFAADLVRHRVDIIVAGSSPAPETARRATGSIPIVVANHLDPVGSGLAASLARPGGNVTGLSMTSLPLRVKQLQLLKNMLPQLTRVAFLRHPTIPVQLPELSEAARSLKLHVSVVEARTPEEIPAAVDAAARAGAGALVVLAGPMFFTHRTMLAEHAAKRRLADLYLLKEHVEAGGFMAYGVDLRDNFRRAAGYVDKILKGANPGDLPIEQPTKFVLTINLKAAKVRRVTVPPAVLVQADQIIE